MAYLAFAENAAGCATAPLPALATATGFSALEWSVIGIARRDRLSTLRQPGRRMARVRTVLFGERPNPRLADTRLEALRRIAVLSWHHGYTVDSDEVRAFLNAGFDIRQYELLVDSIAADRARMTGARARRAA
ncbi:hypothetical protein [Sphingomonas sp.]|uniref:hypothetical protein n=1 Tax=Sphingomonas sp. TaxID=28214 RepID=UPI002D00F0C7|nr:hypothetical protein [Sphingomonas sp.]HTG38702.1 hypothetical protein [Sphingomonas sp.]